MWRERLEDRAVAAEGVADPAHLLLDGLHLVLERLCGLVDALVDLQDRVDPREAGLERDVVQLADDVEDVVELALELRAHRVQLVADLVLLLEAPLHLRDVLAGAGRRAAEADDRNLCGGHERAQYAARSRPLWRSVADGRVLQAELHARRRPARIA